MPDPVPDSDVAATEMVTTDGEAFAATAETAVAVEGLLMTTPAPEPDDVEVVTVSRGFAAIAMPAPTPPPISAATTAAATTGTRSPRRSRLRKAEPPSSCWAAPAGANGVVTAVSAEAGCRC